jgi:hypothetical protein
VKPAPLYIEVRLVISVFDAPPVGLVFVPPLASTVRFSVGVLAPKNVFKLLNTLSTVARFIAHPSTSYKPTPVVYAGCVIVVKFELPYISTIFVIVNELRSIVDRLQFRIEKVLQIFPLAENVMLVRLVFPYPVITPLNVNELRSRDV